jgi:AcrR family transcriptional regulator
MLLLPLAVGVWLSGPVVVHLPLGLFWLLGYFAFYAAGRWLRSRRRRRELTPLLVYGAAAVPPGVVTVVLAPHLVRWVPAFLPLLAASLWLTARRQERSLANDVVTVVAAGLMAPVAYDAGGGDDWAILWVAAGMLTGYFLGTVLYVKTMIRERGRAGYVRASVGYHVALAATAGWLAATGWQSWASVAVWLLLAGRAALGPALNRRRERPMRPVVVGVGEILASLVVTIVVLNGLP